MKADTVDIQTPRVLLPFLEPSRYKAAYGGRGGMKSHFFADLLVEHSLLERGLRSVCIREVQKSLATSSKLLIEDKIKQYPSNCGFKVFKDVIQTPGDGIILFNGMADHNSESVKSLAEFNRAFIEEAQNFSHRSLELLRPTIRTPGSEIWAAWNPRRKTDAIDKFFRSDKQPTNSVILKTGWQDNPWFDDTEMYQERLDDLEMYPDQYQHVWEGAYAGVSTGAYFAASLTLAKSEGRIGRVGIDPLMTTRAFWDIGGTGAKSDAVAIWIVQFIGKEVRVLNYHEAVGQELSFHIAWLKKNGYADVLCVLPHDGVQHDKVYNVTYESALRDAGFKVEVIKNQGTGAAMARIEAVRRLFPSIWFNEDTTESGRDSLGWYHEKKDEVRNIGLGPSHDWASHGADAFGLMAIAHSQMGRARTPRK